MYKNIEHAKPSTIRPGATLPDSGAAGSRTAWHFVYEFSSFSFKTRFTRSRLPSDRIGMIFWISGAGKSHHLNAYRRGKIR
jgi:hypothetical protein